MRWKLSVLIIAAMILLAFTGLAAAYDECDVKCCWEKPCGTKVVQCDQETTFKLIPATDSEIVIGANGAVYITI